jgi:hypothetical protein
MTDRPTVTGAPGAVEASRPDNTPARQLQTPVSAVLDSAHLGDIEGAFGKVSLGDIGERHGWRKRLITFAAIAGPGLIVMVGDNDAGGVSTYAQAGQNYHTSLLWTLILLIPVLIVNQEMVVRLGAVTGVGHARLINERFGKGWGWFSVGDLFVLNFLTTVTEFIGISLAASYAGISKYIAVPTAAVALVAIMASGSFQRWERAMFVFIAVKRELIDGERWATRAEVNTALFEYIEVFYNRERLHSVLDNATPEEYNSQYRMSPNAAWIR